MATKTSKGKLAAEIGAGLVAVGAAAAAGYYFYASDKAKQHRKVAAKWASDMKKQVVKKAESLKKIDAKDFAKVVDAVASTYQGVRRVGPADLKRAASELKKNWRMVQQEIEKSGKKAVKKVKSVTK